MPQHNVLFKGISFKLAKIGVVIALMLGALMSAVQLSFDYRTEVGELASLLTRITEVSTPPAARAVHTLDRSLAREVVNGLMRYPFIIAVSIEDELGEELAGSNRPHLDSRTRWFTRKFMEDLRLLRVPLAFDTRMPQSGEINFVVDMDTALRPFYKNVEVVIWVGMIRSFLLVLCLFVAFYYLLTKPLIRIATEIQQINPGSPGANRLTAPDPENGDEFAQIASSANQLLDAVDLALAKRRAVEVVLRKSEEHIRQIIDSLPVCIGARNREGTYIFANKALAAFLGSTPELMRGSHLDEFSRFFLAPTKDVVALDAQVISKQRDTQTWEEIWISSDGDEHYMHTFITPMEFYDEVVALVVSSDITELNDAQEQMQHMAYHDSLTDLPNRSYLIERLNEEVRRAANGGFHGALLFIDLDQFKHINDSLGHLAGDSVLKAVAGRLRECVSDNDIVVRLGGDEFIVMLTQLKAEFTDAVLEVEEVGERIRGHVSEPYPYSGMHLHVSCSVGIVIYPTEDADALDLLRFADTAMYQVKEQGRNAIQFFNRFMADKAHDVLMLEGELHAALQNEHFVLHYQPRVDVENNIVVGAEALIRWNHPIRGLVSPSEFIHVLETSGLITKVGMWVLEKAVMQVKKWQHQGVWENDMRIAVNISPRQFRSSTFVDDVATLLEREDFIPGLLEMEITETVVIYSLEETINKMKVLLDMGICFSLDDFGTGYSSISYLKELPIAAVKIDQSFVRDITTDRNDRVLVETISAMGRMLNLDVVAEGVETVEQLELVRQYGCPYYQGYLCSEAVDANSFADILKDRRVLCG